MNLDRSGITTERVRACRSFGEFWPHRAVSGDFDERTLDQAVLIRVASGLCPVREIQLAVDVRQVELHCLFGDPELLADRSVGKTSRDGLQNRELALRQPGRLAQASLVDLRESDCMEHRSLDGLPDCRRQIDRIHALDDVAACAVLEGRLDPLGITEDREHDHLHVRAVLLQLVETCEPVHLRHAHVEQHDVRAQPANERKHLASRARVAYDLDVLSTLEGPPDALDHQPMVVRNKNLHSRNSFSRSLQVRISRIRTKPSGSFTKSQYFLTPSIRRRSGPDLDLPVTFVKHILVRNRHFSKGWKRISSQRASWTSKARSGCESAHVRRKKTSSSRCSGSASASSSTTTTRPRFRTAFPASRSTATKSSTSSGGVSRTSCGTLYSSHSHAFRDIALGPVPAISPVGSLGVEPVRGAPWRSPRDPLPSRAFISWSGSRGLGTESRLRCQTGRRSTCSPH